MFFCRDCGRQTDHEREATLPEDRKSGDPDYEDPSKCGVCGEPYACDECGAEWDVVANQCSAVLNHGYHGPERDADG